METKDVTNPAGCGKEHEHFCKHQKLYCPRRHTDPSCPHRPYRTGRVKGVKYVDGRNVT